MKKATSLLIGTLIVMAIVVGVADSQGPPPPSPSTVATRPTQQPATTTGTSASVATSSPRSEPLPTVSANGTTYTVYSLADIERLNLGSPGSPDFVVKDVEIRGAVARLISNTWILLTDGQGHNVLVAGNNGGNPNDPTPLISSLNVGDELVVDGLYGGTLASGDYGDIPSVPPSTPIVMPTATRDALRVTSAGASPASASWTPVLSYTNPAGKTRDDYGDPDTPSFTVTNAHWKILWNVSNQSAAGQGITWGVQAWLVERQDSPTNGAQAIFQEQMANDTSKSGIYQGVGAGTYYMHYVLAPGGVVSLTVEELK